MTAAHTGAITLALISYRWTISCSFSLLLRVLVNGLEQALHVGVLLFRR